MNNKDEIEQQTTNIQNLAEYLKANLQNIDEPIFIELTGTPKSGKTTLTSAFKNFLEKYQIPFFIRRETAEYNPIQDKGTEEYNIWMIMELMKNLSEDLINKKGKIIVLDRGLLDRIPWIDYGVQTGSITAKDAELIKQLYGTDIIGKYKPLTYGFKTSTELSIQRKGGEGRLVNKDSITLFNELFDKQQQFIISHSSKYQLTQTDSYQGRLKEFIMNRTEQMMKDSCELVRKYSREERCK